jgi:hypothetical protein
LHRLTAPGCEELVTGFQDRIPACLELPNLITAGAVDKAGDETSFCTFSKTVVVPANGFEVEDVLPGGGKVNLIEPKGTLKAAALAAGRGS